jgi:hypothetical protein
MIMKRIGSNESRSSATRSRGFDPAYEDVLAGFCAAKRKVDDVVKVGLARRVSAGADITPFYETAIGCNTVNIELIDAALRLRGQVLVEKGKFLKSSKTIQVNFTELEKLRSEMVHFGKDIEREATAAPRDKNNSNNGPAIAAGKTLMKLRTRQNTLLAGLYSLV